MSRLGEIYKAQKAKGGTVTGALGSTLKERAKEKFDPRNLIDQQGLLASMFPSLKAYRSKTNIPKQKTPIPKTSSSVKTPATDTASDKNPSFGISDDLSDSIVATRINSQITAKNTMSLPAMARDINIMRQGIIKLVKASGSEQRNKADAFFKKSSEEESAYESKFGKIKDGLTKQSPTEEKSKGGLVTVLKELFSSIGSLGKILTSFVPKLLSGLTSILPSVLTFLASPAGIASIVAIFAVLGIKKLLEDAKEGEKKKRDLSTLRTKKEKGETLSPEEQSRLNELEKKGITETSGEARNKATKGTVTYGEAKQVVESNLSDEEIKQQYGVSRKVLTEYVKREGKVAAGENGRISPLEMLSREMGEEYTGAKRSTTNARRTGDTGYKPTGATPAAAPATGTTPTTPAAAPATGTTPTTPAAAPATGTTPTTGGAAGTTPSRSATPGESLYSIGGGKAISASDMQKIISAHEGNADSVYGDYTNRSTKKLENKYGLRPPEWAAANLGQAKPLSEFTFEELRNYQLQRPTSTGAAGIAGFMPSTIFGRDMSGSMAAGGVFAKSGLSWKDKFSKENQEKLQQVMSAEQDAVLLRGLKKLGINEITPGMKLAANYVGPAGLLWTIEEGQKDPNISVRDAIMKHNGGKDPTKGPGGSVINADLATTKASQFVQAKEAFTNAKIASMGIQTVATGTGGQQPSLAQAAAASPPVSASPTPSEGGASSATPSAPSSPSPTPAGGAASTPSSTTPTASSGTPVMTGAGVPLTSGATGAPVTTTTPSAGGAAGTVPPPPATSATPAASGTGKKTTEAKGVDGGLVSLQTKSGRSVQVAEKYAGNFQGFINDLEALGYQIRAIGGYAYRQNVNDPTKLSVHSRGMAIDINDKENKNKSTQTDLPPETAQLAKKWGLGWGMNWKSVKDPMHFSAAKEEGGSESPKPLGATAGETKKQDDKLKPTDSEHASKGGGSPAISPSAAPSGTAATTPATSSSGGGGSPVMTGAGTPLTSGATGAPVTTTPPSPAPAVTSTPAPMSSAPSTGQKLTQMNAEVSTAKEEKQNIVVQQAPPAVIQQPQQQRQQPVASPDPGKPASVFDRDVMEALFKRQGPSFSLV